MSDSDDATLPDSRASQPPSFARTAGADPGERYTVGEVIGRGGMGEVRVARDTRIQRDVAIKLLRSNHRDEVAWHLRQMLPRATDKVDTTGRVAKS